jgi:hypothetical protein
MTDTPIGERLDAVLEALSVHVLCVECATMTHSSLLHPHTVTERQIAALELAAGHLEKAVAALRQADDAPRPVQTEDDGA